MLIENTSVTAQCLDLFKDHVLNNTHLYMRTSAGSIENDSPDFSVDWNVPRNHSSMDICDSYSYDFEVLLQNETNGIVKLCSLYQPGDFIGWHTNSAVSGYNLILTYSDNTESYFETQQGKVYDLQGWSYKINTFDDNLFWHRAVSQGNRITISMLFETQEDLQSGLDRIQNL